MQATIENCLENTAPALVWFADLALFNYNRVSEFLYHLHKVVRWRHDTLRQNAQNWCSRGRDILRMYTCFESKSENPTIMQLSFHMTPHTWSLTTSFKLHYAQLIMQVFDPPSNFHSNLFGSFCVICWQSNQPSNKDVDTGGNICFWSNTVSICTVWQ